MAEADDSVWRAQVERTIGASFETLVARSADGIEIAPLYRRYRADPGCFWRERSAWAVSQRVDHPDAEASNQLALAELEGGADALTLVFAGSSFARGFGLAAADLDQVLADVELDFIDLRLDAGTDTSAVAEALGALVARRTLTSAGLRIDLGYDPIGAAARDGSPANLGEIAGLLSIAEKAGLAGCPLLADGRVWHEAGASEALELAGVLATGVAYLRMLEQVGLSLDAAREKIAVLLAVDADVLLGLAKVRALRRLWARIEAASELEPRPLRLHAETAWRMMTRRDPWTNAMRATAATFAAGLGGADAITVLPMTLASGLPDAPPRRLARNVQRVLIDEANLAMIDDPAAGAGGFEALTDGLCLTAWRLFQEIEAEGGIAASLERGALQSRLADAAATRATAVATIDRGIVGTSRFASLDAPTPGVLDVAPGDRTSAAPGALPCLRDAASFEALRDRAGAQGKAPGVFLATLGAPAAFGPRATWARNFFASAGLAATASTSEQDAAALAAGFAESGALVACLCGTDKAYAADAEALVVALRDQGARRILAAGRPGDGFANVDAFVYDGCDALEVLGATLDVIGAPEARDATLSD